MSHPACDRRNHLQPNRLGAVSLCKGPGWARREAFKDIRFAALPAPQLLPAPLALPALVLLTDETSTHPRLARDTWNPLFAVHRMEAMARDPMGRPCRESWLASEQRRYQDLALQPWMTYRNHVRRRCNHDEESPAQKLGFVERRMKCGEVLSWRQAWGRASIHPLARSAESVEEWMRRRVCARLACDPTSPGRIQGVPSR